MAWTSVLKDFDKTNVSAFVVFTDQVKYKTGEWFDLKGQTADSFRNTVEARRKYWEMSYTFIDGLDKTFDLTPTVPVTDPITQAGLDFQVAYAVRWIRMSKAISAGLLLSTDQVVIDAEKDCATKWSNLVSAVGIMSALDYIN